VSPTGPSLARRLRALREMQWPDTKITQVQLAKALHVSAPLISSWERTVDPAVPSEERLRAYALFFCTPRSVDGKYRTLDPHDLTATERESYTQLIEELLSLRNDSSGRESRSQTLGGPWHFDDEYPVTIIIGELPDEIRKPMPMSDPADPDHSTIRTLSDPDALIELYGHIRAANPRKRVTYQRASTVASDTLTASHVVLLGGIDWNPITRELFRLLDLPIRQTSADDEPDRGSFDVSDGSVSRSFRPTVYGEGTSRTVVEDVAHFVRAPNRFGRGRTLTVCNGIFGRGVYGAVRALTDANLRDSNADYVNGLLARGDTVSILSRVRILNNKVITPDWTDPESVLHEWIRGR
jgi:transcriptional regulator with XRE-family HTH domain